MYEDTASGCNFDPNNSMTAETVINNPSLPPPQFKPETPQNHNSNSNGNSNSNRNIFVHVEEDLRLSMEELSYHHHHGQHHNNNNNHPHQEDTAMEIELQNEMGFNMDHHISYNNIDNNNNNNANHFLSYEQQLPSWDIHEMQHQHQLQDITTTAATPYPPTTPDLLNLLHLPRCSPSSVLPNSSISFTNPHSKTTNFANSLGFLGDLPPAGVDSPAGTASSVLYDPLFHLNLPPQPPLFRELLQSLPHGYSLQGSRSGSLFSNGGDEREGSGGVYPDVNGVLEFSREMGLRRARDGKGTKHYTTERIKRIEWNGKYAALRDLVPNPTKTDRASIVKDAIDYIEELRRTVDELKLLVEKKRCGRERSKRRKTEEGARAGDDESCNMKPLGDDHDQSYNNGSLRSSWLQRKSKDTEVDVRIIDDEVTIKLIQKRNINLLLFVSKLLDELQLDLHHVAGGLIGNSYSFLFNTKMFEGSCLYANAIASKLIEVLDRQYAAIPPPLTSY